MINDRILAVKVLHRFEPVRRGGVIGFRFPQNPTRDFVKRVIALPGERVRLREGGVFVNQRCISAHGYTIRPDLRNCGPITVPSAMYFVPGDTRNNSEDRFFGYVPRANSIGTALLIYWPPGRVGVCLRLNPAPERGDQGVRLRQSGAVPDRGRPRVAAAARSTGTHTGDTESAAEPF